MGKARVTKKKYELICQAWEESERGWGVRPDGYTLHLHEEDRKKFVAWYYRTYNNKSYVPEEYTRTSGTPFTVVVDKKTYDKVKENSKAGNPGLWGQESICPIEKKELVFKGKV